MDLNLWKNKDELKQFLSNLGVEYRYGCFEEKNPEVCHLLGDYLSSIDKNLSKAAQVYEMNCSEYKFGLSCDAFGRMCVKGSGMEGPDLNKALNYFLKGCDYNEYRACYHAGQMHTTRDTRLDSIFCKDIDKGYELLEKACVSNKSPQSCSLLHAYALTGAHNRPKDFDRAIKFGTMACEQDEQGACYNLFRMYKIGDGIKKDQEKSEYFKKKALFLFKAAYSEVVTTKVAEPDAE